MNSHCFVILVLCFCVLHLVGHVCCVVFLVLADFVCALFVDAVFVCCRLCAACCVLLGCCLLFFVSYPLYMWFVLVV